MDESREKRRNNFFDIWSRKKQGSAKGSPSDTHGSNLGPRSRRQHGYLNERHLSRPPSSRDSSSSSSSSHSIDSDSEESSSIRPYRHQDAYHQERSEEYSDEKNAFHSPALAYMHDDEHSFHRVHNLDRSYPTQFHTSQDVHRYSREQLFALTPKKLRELGLTLGLDPRLSQKADLVEAINNHLQPHPHTGHGYRGQEDTFHETSRRLEKRIPEERISIESEAPDDYNQMILLLREIIPFYGQGDVKTDSIVRQTIAKLPKMYLDMQDSRFGNTILLLCIQHGIFDLVSLLLQKGCDPNIPNYDGSIGLHFLCHPESIMSLEVAQVNLNFEPMYTHESV